MKNKLGFEGQVRREAGVGREQHLGQVEQEGRQGSTGEMRRTKTFRKLGQV